jgi:hypothetical protein
MRGLNGEAQVAFEDAAELADTELSMREARAGLARVCARGSGGGGVHNAVGVVGPGR